MKLLNHLSVSFNITMNGYHAMMNRLTGRFNELKAEDPSIRYKDTTVLYISEMVYITIMYESGEDEQPATNREPPRYIGMPKGTDPLNPDTWVKVPCLGS